MLSRVTRKALLLAALMLASSAAVGADHPPEPSDYRLDDYRSPVPATLRGVRVVDAEGALTLWNAGRAHFVDVLPRPPKPATKTPGPEAAPSAAGGRDGVMAGACGNPEEEDGTESAPDTARMRVNLGWIKSSCCVRMHAAAHQP